MWDATIAAAAHKAALASPLPSRDGGPGSDIVDAMLGWYVQSQLMSIRRLIDHGDYKERKTEPDIYKIESERGVYSLASIIGYIRQNRRLFTRKRLGRRLGFPQPPSGWFEKYFAVIAESDGEACDASTQYDYFQCEDFHRLFDKLSGVDVSQRSDDDTVHDDFLTRMQRDLDKVESSIKLVVDKTIAHAASDTSFPSSMPRVRWSTLLKCQKRVCRVYWSISLYVMGFMHPVMVPEPAHPVAFGLDNASLGGSFESDFENAWQRFRSQAERWHESARYVAMRQ
jgi:hypothetical protein